MQRIAFFQHSGDITEARLTRVRGSSPREAGATIWVSERDIHGTVGGGQLEYMVIDQARALLASGGQTGDMDVPLGPEIGQCCGGRVEVALTRLDQAAQREVEQRLLAERENFPHVYILGAGHVGRALAACCALLPVKTILIDSRAEELARATAPVEQRLSPIPEADIRSAPANSAFVVLTHDHAQDFLLTAEALTRGDAAYVGMIGSATKRVSFRNWCRQAQPDTDQTPLVCPIGGPSDIDKRPEVIAAMVAAEVMAAFAKNNKPAETPQPARQISRT